MGFQLHEQLGRDTVNLGRLSLSRLLLMRDANYPWVVLVPERERVRELFELSLSEQQELMREIAVFSRLMHESFQGDKINVATLGNMVPQLHIHLIVRYQNDVAWPKPVWGAVASKSYTDDELASRIDDIKALMVEARSRLSLAN